MNRKIFGIIYFISFIIFPLLVLITCGQPAGEHTPAFGDILSPVRRWGLSLPPDMAPTWLGNGSPGHHPGLCLSL